MDFNTDSLPKRIDDFVSKQQIQKGKKGAIAGGIVGGLLTGHPLGVIGGAYLGHKNIGFGSRSKGKGKLKGLRASKPSKTKYTPGSAKRIKR